MSDVGELTQEEAEVLQAIVQRLGPIPEGQLPHTMKKIREYLANRNESFNA